MRLIDTSSLKLETFFGDQIPLYAILSHTWGQDELLFEELQAGIGQAAIANPKRGLHKVLKTCEQAKKDNLKYAWVDTCCIDKSSSAELSEAINSMFRWYEDSAACYIYLEDVSHGGFEMGITEISASKWFTRGWTLQELIAPHGATFFDGHWNKLASRAEIALHISRKTGIEKALLEREHNPIQHQIQTMDTSQRRRSNARCRFCGAFKNLQTILQQYGVAAKMRWAAFRNTTREEDIAYCLLGLFGINMPLLYGEGTEAFRRLQEEVVKHYPADQSILAWVEEGTTRQGATGLFAKSPSAFCLEGDMLAKQPAWRGDIKIASTPRGVEVDVWLIPRRVPGSTSETDGKFTDKNLFIAVLDCLVNTEMLPRLGIFVSRLQGHTYHRARTSVMALLNTSEKSRLVRPQRRFDGELGRSVVSTAFPALATNFDVDAATTLKILLIDYSWIPGVPSNDLKSISDQSPLVINIQDTTSFSMVASSPPLIKTPTGSTIFGPPLSKDPGAMNLHNVDLTGLIYFSQGNSNGFFVVCGRRFTVLTDSNTSHMCTFLSWREFQDRSLHPELWSYWRKDLVSQGPSPSETNPTTEQVVRRSKTKTSLPLAPETISKEFKIRLNVRKVKFLGRESSELFVQILAPY